VSRLHSLIASGLIVVGLVVSGTLVGVPSPTRHLGARAEEQSDRSPSSTEPATGDAEDPGPSAKPGDQAPGRGERGGGSDRERPEPGRGDQKQSQNAQDQGKQGQETRKPSKAKQRTRDRDSSERRQEVQGGRGEQGGGSDRLRPEPGRSTTRRG
jgi:hypothetical protein